MAEGNIQRRGAGS